jgi:hypothetical protein
MKLECGGSVGRADVSGEDIIRAFADDAGRGEFIILSQSDQVYIQAYGEGDDPFLVEYREGDAQHHFHSVEDHPKDVVQSLFLKYLDQDDSWKTDIEWEQEEQKPWWKFW